GRRRDHGDGLLRLRRGRPGRRVRGARRVLRAQRLLREV
ncbi:MAG: hypothetical protein AVDCRST_MAG53-220, partial [uncultured Solirubrobacteraceae bacterium]